MSDSEKTFGFSMFGPVHLAWDDARQELAIGGKMGLSDGAEEPLQVFLHGEAAIQLLGQFRTLLDRVDEERIGATMPRDLQ